MFLKLAIALINLQEGLYNMRLATIRAILARYANICKKKALATDNMATVLVIESGEMAEIASDFRDIKSALGQIKG